MKKIINEDAAVTLEMLEEALAFAVAMGWRPKEHGEESEARQMAHTMIPTAAIAKRQMLAATVAAFRPAVARLVSRMAPPEHRAEAEQVGLIGVLVALGKHSPIDLNFEDVAIATARDEIRAWLNAGTVWRKVTA